MAARENQGLQIALISFVILTILLSVFTYLLFSNWKDAQLKAEKANGDMAEANKKVAATEQNMNDLKMVMGVGPSEDFATVRKSIVDLANDPALGLSQLPESDKNEKKILTTLLDGLKSRDTKIDNMKNDQEADRKKAESNVATANQKATDAEKVRDNAVAELDKERANYKAAVEALKAEKDQLVADKTSKNKETDALKADYERKLADAQNQVTAATKDVGRIKDELKKYYHLDPSASGGAITWINQRENMAYLNLGWDDGLHRRITFSVFPQGTTDIAKATAKGKIEVINVTGPHLAEARIIDNPPNDPLLPGDLVHTEGWHPGQHEHFAIAGMVDIDGTGRDQTEKLVNLIQANGGYVDAVINVNLKAIDPKDNRPTATVKGLGPNGEGMTVNTRFLILGEMTTEKQDSQIRIAASSTMMNEAKRLNVETIGLQKFLGMMGYTPRSAAAAGGEGGSGAAGAAPADNGFRARKPPAAEKTDSAF
jgi:hypothetical protein